MSTSAHRRQRRRVLDGEAIEERQVFLDEGLVRLLAGERRVLPDLLAPLAEHEVELRRQRLLYPQRAVIVERGDAVRHRDETGAGGRRGRDEVNRMSETQWNMNCPARRTAACLTVIVVFGLLAGLA
jgi:hypothetical protein